MTIKTIYIHFFTYIFLFFIFIFFVTMAPRVWQLIWAALPFCVPYFAFFNIFFQLICVFCIFQQLLRSSATKDRNIITFAFCFFIFSQLFEPASGDPLGCSSIVYTRDQLLALDRVEILLAGKPDVPAEIRRKRRGCRAGVKRRERRRRYKPCLPSVTMGNVRALSNKLDELTALMRLQRVYRESSLLCFTETWLNQDMTNSVVSVTGFTLVRADRSAAQSGKKKGGGLAVFVNDRWCNPNHITVKEQHCSKDIELVAVSVGPYYLPREFSHVLVVTVYIPPSADAAVACDRVHGTVSQLQTQHPQALILISGDFNHACTPLSATLSNFTQYVNCLTRDRKTLDLFYANIKNAYASAPLPPLGRSDHNLVHLSSAYTPVVKQQKPQIKTVKIWTEEVTERLRDCFSTTDWDVLCSPHGEDIDSLTDCITDYVNFCVENTVQTKSVQCFSNNKPWVTPELKTLLNEKKRAFLSGDKEELRRVQRDLKYKIRKCKDCYRKKLEQRLEQNNIRDVWRGLKHISGHAEAGNGRQVTGDQTWANELNLFFNRFDSAQPPVSTHSAPSSHLSSSGVSSQLQLLPPQHQTVHSPLLPTEAKGPPQRLTAPDQPPPTHPPTPLCLTLNQVRMELRRTKARKATGPDSITSRLLRECADQLCVVMLFIFNMSLRLEKVPVLWRTSCLVPVPKVPRPTEPNHFRPVALTSHLMKAMERIILSHLRTQVSSALDPLQFAYRPGIGVDDAIITCSIGPCLTWRPLGAL
ncbi:uncharacterized protein LOC110013806 isoform X2 [Oryzias latipes]